MIIPIEIISTSDKQSVDLSWDSLLKGILNNYTTTIYINTDNIVYFYAPYFELSSHTRRIFRIRIDNVTLYAFEEQYEYLIKMCANKSNNIEEG